MTQKQFERWKKLMYIGYKVCRCHQLRERSFFFRDMQFPVCARCTGIVLGFFLLGPVITVFTFGNMYISLSLIFIMCADGFLQLWNIFKSNNIRRLLTGLGFGYAIFSAIVHVISKTVALF